MKTKWKDCVFVDLRLRSEQKKEETESEENQQLQENQQSSDYKNQKWVFGLLWLTFSPLLFLWLIWWTAVLTPNNKPITISTWNVSENQNPSQKNLLCIQKSIENVLDLVKLSLIHSFMCSWKGQWTLSHPHFLESSLLWIDCDIEWKFKGILTWPLFSLWTGEIESTDSYPLTKVEVWLRYRDGTANLSFKVKTN